MIPVTDILISNVVISKLASAPSVLPSLARPALAPSSSESFASTCASLLLSAFANDASLPTGDSKQFPKVGSSTDLPRGSKTKSKDAQQDSPVDKIKSAAPISVPVAVPQVAQAQTATLTALLAAALPDPSGLKPLPVIAGSAPATPSGSVSSQIPPTLQIGPDALAGTSKPDGAGVVAPLLAVGRTTEPAPVCSHPLSPRLNPAERSPAPVVNKDATAGSLPVPETQAPATDRIAVAMLHPPSPETVKQSNSAGEQMLPAIHSDSPSQGSAEAISISHGAPANAAAGMPHESLAGPEANLLLKSIQKNIQQAPASLQVVLPQIDSSQVDHQPVAVTPPAKPSATVQPGKANAANAENPLVAIDAPGPHRVPNILVEARNGSSLSYASVLDPRPTPDPRSIPANISAVSGSAALPLPQIDGSHGAGTTSIASRDHHSTTSSPASTATTPLSVLSPKESPSQNLPRDATQPVHKTSVAATAAVAAAPIGVPQSPPVAASGEAGRSPAASLAITPESLPRQISGTPATSAEAAHLPPRVAEPPAALSVGPVQVAQIVNKASQAEMRIGLTTSAFGNVEVRTVVHATEVGLAIGSERGDLRGLMGNELPGIANTLQQQNLRLHEVNFHQGFTFSGNLSSGDQSQPRSFGPTPGTARSPGVEASGDKSIEPGAAEISGRSHSRLNILA